MSCYTFHLPGPMVWTEMFVLVSMFVCVGSHVLDLENYNPKTKCMCWVPCFGFRELVLDLENFNPKTLHLSPATSVLVGSLDFDLKIFARKCYIFHLPIPFFD